MALAIAFAANAGPDAGVDPPWIESVMSSFDSMSHEDLWPNFDAHAVPLLVYDGTSTWLWRHPKPPKNFSPSKEVAGLFSLPGMHPLIRANGSVLLEGQLTAAVDLRHANRRFPRAAAALVIHEAFHVYQHLHHKDWFADEAKAFAFPADDLAMCERRRLESMALARALSAEDAAERMRWTKAALKVRHERFAAMGPGPVDYERATELDEGLATYVEQRALKEPGPLVLDLPPKEFRKRAYASGRALALLLDRSGRSWRKELDAKTHPLDELLERAVASNKTAPAELSEADRQVASQGAAAEVKEFREQRAAAKEKFLASTGWQLIIDAQKDPLLLRQYDPLNLLRFGDREVLHGHMLKASNDEGDVEIIGHASLTEGSGEHPLFDGITRMTVSGLATEPRVIDSPKGVSVTSDGINVHLTKARLSRNGKSFLLTIVP